MQINPQKLKRVQGWVAKRYPIVASLSLLCVIVLLIGFWMRTHPPLPETITIASGHNQGLYNEFATLLQAPLEANTQSKVIVKETMGSQENHVLLKTGEADLAIIQAGAVDMDQIAALIPLYPDVVIPVVRIGSGIKRMEDLDGRKILIGPQFSGMRQSATNILDHYDLEIIDSEAPFEQLLHDSSYDGAIVTTGLFNDNLHEILSTGEFTILDIPHAPAIAQKYAYFSLFEIPAGLYAESPSIPHHPLRTVSTTSFLAAHKNAPENMIAATLDTLYSTDFTRDIPNLKSYEEASAWNIFPMHPASQHYFQPYEGIEDLANLLSSLEAIKELLIATGASIFLIWRVRKFYRELIKEQAIETQKEKLESLLQETLKVERKHITESDPDELEKLLNQITNTKLRAFEMLMGHGIIDQQSFTLFLIQCDNLSSKIRLKQDAEMDKVRMK